MNKVFSSMIAALSVVLISHPANSQIVPQPWVSVGTQGGDLTYGLGARAIGWGVELGTGEDGATGVDVLKFIDLPVNTSNVGLPPISPYVGLGYYSNDAGLSYSGGVQVGATKNVTVGVGYNSVRGINAQVGIKF
ncbi:hypothetical protein [Merismopedia glauca]|uniref:Outer membrane protein beta-barrel domain-containing protein n=1 Tax=Merismopedia glauca CCAP 1448/3 TaxID=1296344 RepID=A0A2T1BZZ1_9CYAN|nr:hypothetical protein [Merismopedia glauca]PSB01478.1 hypothetical protein C7B64_18105 [Merismopedia glauca CCAP 1448/3]